LNNKRRHAFQFTKLNLQLLCHTCHLVLHCTHDMHDVANCSFLCPCGWLSAVLYNVENYDSVETTSNIKGPAKYCLQRANMHMVSLGAHAQELMKCSRIIHQMQLKHTSSNVIQNCTGAAKSRLRVATTIICT